VRKCGIANYGSENIIMANLKETYQKKITGELAKQLGFANHFAVPRIEKVVVNVGVGRLRADAEQEEVVKYLSLITGQRMHPRRARIAIAAFKTRAGMTVGYRATLRGRRMYDFLTRLIDIALPRMRDFQGIDAAKVDHNGNLTIGIKENIVFPEMIGEEYKFLFGFEVTVVTTSSKREHGLALLRAIGVPFAK
jgi:large subunit ribosomal protein L5